MDSKKAFRIMKQCRMFIPCIRGYKLREHTVDYKTFVEREPSFFTLIDRTCSWMDARNKCIVPNASYFVKLSGMGGIPMERVDEEFKKRIIGECY